MGKTEGRKKSKGGDGEGRHKRGAENKKEIGKDKQNLEIDPLERDKKRNKTHRDEMMAKINDQAVIIANGRQPQIRQVVGTTTMASSEVGNQDLGEGDKRGVDLFGGWSITIFEVFINNL